LDSPRSSYREYAPAPALRPYVSCFWSWVLSDPPCGYAHRVLPDGCIDIIFEIADGGGWPARVVGTMQRSQIFQPVDTVQLIAVRFRPGGAVPFFGFSAHEITDDEVDLPTVWSNEGNFDERMHDEAPVAVKVGRLQRALLDRLADVSPPDPRIAQAVTWLESRRAPEIERLAADLDVSRQHMRRLFLRHVGVGAKTFQRVLRVQRLVAGFGGSTEIDWSAAALDAGFYDQAHMAGECRRLTGATPTQLVGS